MDNPNIFHQHCATRKALEIITDKWVVLILHALAEGTKRYGELKRQVEGITHKMLSQTLDNLERDGLIHRQMYAVMPPHVEYSLTPLGESLAAPLSALCGWATAHYHEVEAARSANQATPEAVSG